MSFLIKILQDILRYKKDGDNKRFRTCDKRKIEKMYCVINL